MGRGLLGDGNGGWEYRIRKGTEERLHTSHISISPDSHFHLARHSHRGDGHLLDLSPTGKGSRDWFRRVGGAWLDT
jgi:hypothetical protein